MLSWFSESSGQRFIYRGWVEDAFGFVARRRSIHMITTINSRSTQTQTQSTFNDMVFDLRKCYVRSTQDDSPIAEKWITWDASCTDEPADDLCVALYKGWKPIEILRTLLYIFEEIILNDEENYEEDGGKLQFLQDRLQLFKDRDLGSTCEHFDQKHLPEAYRTGYELSEDLQIHKAQWGIYNFDFQLRVNKHAKHVKVPIAVATAVWRLNVVRERPRAVGGSEETGSGITDLQIQLEGTHLQPSTTENQTSDQLSVTGGKLSSAEEQIRQSEAEISTTVLPTLSDLYSAVFPDDSIHTLESVVNA
jgi:hypothetical protein